MSCRRLVPSTHADINSSCRHAVVGCRHRAIVWRALIVPRRCVAVLPTRAVTVEVDPSCHAYIIVLPLCWCCRAFVPSSCRRCAALSCRRPVVCRHHVPPRTVVLLCHRHADGVVVCPGAIIKPPVCRRCGVVSRRAIVLPSSCHRRATVVRLSGCARLCRRLKRSYLGDGATKL